MRWTRSSHPWALTTRHPWRVMVRRNTAPPPPDGACPPCIETLCRFAGTGALCVVTWMGCPSAEHCGLDVDPQTKSHGRIHSGGGGSVRRTITRHGWRVGSAQGWLERVRRTEPPSPVHHPQSAHRTSVTVHHPQSAHRTSVTRAPSAVGTPNLRRPYTIRSRHAKFRPGRGQSLSIQLIRDASGVSIQSAVARAMDRATELAEGRRLVMRC